MRLFCCLPYNLRKKHFLIIFIILNCACLYAIHKIITKESELQWNKLRYVVVHIDLKGAPPKMRFLKSMISELKKLGANALLMEYEDMFPYKNDLVNLSRTEHYTENELKDFLTEANALGLEVIPLIQTFGHMEFVLKLKEFKHLREDSSFPDSICPSKLGTDVLIGTMLRQIMQFHNNITPLKHIHIGCDEVYHINQCDDCIEKGLRKHELYLEHVYTVSKHVWSLSPNTTVLFWDDMLRSILPENWRNFESHTKLEPVFWRYTSDMNWVHLPLYLYHLHFKNIWVASAFKGADGNDTEIPNYKERTSNILAWMKIIIGYYFGGEKDVYPFKGIVLTGWSRYTHFAPLCELLPVSYVSLITSLLIVNKYQNKNLPKDVYTINWDKDDRVFNKYFINDYYRKVGCKMDNSCSCILNSTIPLYGSVKQYVDLLKRAGTDLTQIEKKNNGGKDEKYKQCYKMYNRLSVYENNVKLNLEPFYSWKVRKEYLMKSLPVFMRIAQCLGIKGKQIRTYGYDLNRIYSDFPHYADAIEVH